MSSTSGSTAKSRVEELAQKIRIFLLLDDLDFSCEERMALELVEVLKDVSSVEEQDKLLHHFVTEAWGCMGYPCLRFGKISTLPSSLHATGWIIPNCWLNSSGHAILRLKTKW